MSVRIVRLGTPRAASEGTRLGTVRRPPRGVPKKDFSRLDWYDVWYPVLAPSAATMKLGLSADRTSNGRLSPGNIGRKWPGPPPASRWMCWRRSRITPTFSVGCYCENPARCHRSLLHELLVERGAKLE